MTRIVAISDTHGFHDELELPEGELLVHAGDFSRLGAVEELERFLEWFAAQPHPHKVFVAGNHDRALEREPDACAPLLEAAAARGVTYLQDSAVELAGLSIWGSPWTPEFCSWSFMLPRGEALAKVWSKIPADLDLLITHGPPYGHGDLAHGSPHPRAVGCTELLAAVRQARPRLHLFGHIHEGYGATASDAVPGTVFATAATCTVRYAPTQPPLVLDLPG